MKRASYRDGLNWIIMNDDTEWLDDEHGTISVSASLLADLFDKTDDAIKRDLIRTRTRHNKTKVMMP